MKSNKPAKLTKKDVVRHKKIEERLKAERVTLDNPKGKEKFFKALSSPFKKK